MANQLRINRFTRFGEVKCDRAYYHLAEADAQPKQMDATFEEAKSIQLSDSRVLKAALFTRWPDAPRASGTSIERDAKTREFLSSGPGVLLRPLLREGICTFEIDAMQRLDDGSLHLHSAHAAKSIKDAYRDRLALFACLLPGNERANIRFQISTVNPDFELTEDAVFSSDTYVLTHDQSGHILDSLGRARGYIDHYTQILSSATPPDAEIMLACRTCEHRLDCKPETTEGHLVWVPKIRTEKVRALQAKGLTHIDQLSPTDILELKSLGPTIERMKRSLACNRPIVEQEFYETIGRTAYPWAFLDFEVYNGATPVAYGSQPFDRIPTQFSCHTISEPGGEVTHTEYLHDDRSQPHEPFAQALWEAISGAQTIFSYCTFEGSVIETLVDASTVGSKIQQHFTERELDLEELIRKTVYHRDFEAYTSIKKVLPALCSDVSYQRLGVRDGTEAVWAYWKMLNSPEDSDERKVIRRELLEYCKLDTWAMVRIVEELLKLGNSVPNLI